MKYTYFDTQRMEPVKTVVFPQNPTAEELEKKLAELNEAHNYRPGRCVLVLTPNMKENA